MSIRMRLFCLLVATITLASAAVYVSNSKAVMAQADAAQLKVVGLKDKVTVRRDERGIPYIEAANERDLYFAQGYVIASDRLWQMDVLRRSARGELAEIFGRVVLEEDKRRRTYGFAQASEKIAANVTGDARVALDAVVSGVEALLLASRAARFCAS